VYVGGAFDAVGGELHKALAAVDSSTGVVAPWKADGDPDAVVYALVADGATVYAGGLFSTINDQPRNCLVALDAATAAVTNWDPKIYGWAVANSQPVVHALARHGHTIYAGGDFYTLGGQARPCLAALDDSLGAAAAWAPRADSPVWAVAISGSTLYAGGSFGSIGLLPTPGLAAMSIPDDPAVEPPEFALSQNTPNPARVATNIQFTLPAASVATLSVFDLQGRRIARPVDHALLGPGQHNVPVRFDGWKPGVYLYRFEAAGRSATRKLVVIG
jgi:hypothetical protein